MNPRIKKLIGTLILLAGLAVYIGAVARIAEAIPKHWLAELLYFMVAGVAWAAPAMPLIGWMNREPEDRG